MTIWVADTSVAVAMLLASHEAHDRVTELVGQREIHLTSHSALETYSVLTRLPGDARLQPDDAALLLDERFGQVLVLTKARSVKLVNELARKGIAGGAVYDALIAATAVEASSMLLTRDKRAEATYQKLGVDVELLG